MEKSRKNFTCIFIKTTNVIGMTTDANIKVVKNETKGTIYYYFANADIKRKTVAKTKTNSLALMYSTTHLGFVCTETSTVCYLSL